MSERDKFLDAMFKTRAKIAEVQGLNDTNPRLAQWCALSQWCGLCQQYFKFSTTGHGCDACPYFLVYGQRCSRHAETVALRKAEEAEQAAAVEAWCEWARVTCDELEELYLERLLEQEEKI